MAMLNSSRSVLRLVLSSSRSQSIASAASTSRLPPLRTFVSSVRLPLLPHSLFSSRTQKSQSQLYSSGLLAQRSFSSTPRSADAQSVASTAVVEAESHLREPVSTSASSLSSTIQASPALETFTPPLPPPVEVIAPTETLLDAANVELINLSGTLDLSLLEGSWGLHPIWRLQSMFIQLHESFPLLGHGLPWYILIPAVTVILRLLLFSFQVRAQSNAARMAIIQPQMLAGMEKLKAAKARGDFMGAQTAQIETQTLMRDNNVNPIKNLAFPLAQATVFMTMFFALKGLAGAEIPTMMTEGLGWVQNLTEPDPYWVLPVASTALTLATLELGVDSTTQVQTSTTKNMKLFFRVMLLVALPFIAYFPAALLLYWVTNNSISLFQSILLKQAPVRALFGIPTVPPKAQIGEKGYVAEPSFSEAFKNVQIGMSDKWEETKDKSDKEAARQRAFSAAATGSERAPIYAPRAPIQKRLGKVAQVSEELTEGFRQVGISPEPVNKREMAFEDAKKARAAAARAKRVKRS